MFKDKIAVITGGSHGIGLAAAQEFIKAGANVAVMDLNPCDESVALFYACNA